MAKNISTYPFDANYLTQLREGHSATWDHFISYFTQRLTIKLLRQGLTREVTEDVIQETFVRVLEDLQAPGKTPSATSFGAFVWGVCNNYLVERFQAVEQHDSLLDRYHQKAKLSYSRRQRLNQELWRWSEYLLYLVLPTEERDCVPGDLLEEYRVTILPKFGLRLARVWFMTQVLSSIWPFLRRRIVRVLGAAAILRLLR